MSKEKSSDFNFSKENTKKEKKQVKAGFGKVILLPFLMAIIGTLLVLFLAGFLPARFTFFSNLANLIYGRNTPIETYVHASNTDKNILELKDFNANTINIANKLLPSVVGIEIELNVSSVFGGSSKNTVTGSGFIISDDGHILTNNHVINPKSNNSFISVSEANKVTVILHDKTKLDAKIIGKDELTDLAVIKVDKTNLPKVEFGDSDKLQIGEFAMAIGRPLSLENSVTVGVISGLEREITQGASSFKAIQTDAAINSGNSGGPLVNVNGKVVGVTTIKAMGIGVDSLNFAIPINQAKAIATELIENKTINRPELGISGLDITPAMQQQLGLKAGVYVQQVKEGSAAEKAGILMQDLITKIGDKEIKSFTDINSLKDNIKSGTAVDVTIIRSGKEQTLKLTMP